jgi:hypothetical protein
MRARERMWSGEYLLASLLILVLASALLPGCGTRRKAVVVHHPNAHVVVIKKGHAHSANCGHYRHGGKWYFIKGHVHRKGCGHRKVKGVWVIK